MSRAAAHMAAIECVLKMPPRDHSLWLNMNNNQRRAVLIMAGLPAEWHKRQWTHLTGAEQVKILDQVHEAAKWKALLQGPA